MFGRHFGSPFEGKWAARQGWRGHFGPGGGHRGRHGGGGEFRQARRMLAQGGMPLLALALIAEPPRHRHELIKAVADKTPPPYSPRPASVYPPLTYPADAHPPTTPAAMPHQ